MEEVSILLGHSSVRITEKHYASWVPARQEILKSHVAKTWDTFGVIEGGKAAKNRQPWKAVPDLLRLLNVKLACSRVPRSR